MCQVGDIYVEQLVAGFYCEKSRSIITEKVEREYVVIKVFSEDGTFIGYCEGEYKMFKID